MKKVTLRQGTIHYREAGTGPVVVFVHGLLVAGDLWDPVVDRLAAAGYRCIAPTWPLGSHPEPLDPAADLSPRGMATLVADFLEALGLEDVTLVGNDSGGAICQLVVTRHPARIGRLVLTTCDAFEVFPPAPFAYLHWLAFVPGAMGILAWSLALMPILLRLPIAYGNLTRTRLPSSMLRAWSRPSLSGGIRRDVRKFVRGMVPAVTQEAAKELGGFRRPALVLWASEEKNFPLSLGERLTALLPDARMETVGGALVFASIDQPDAIAGAIDRFQSGRARVSQAV